MKKLTPKEAIELGIDSDPISTEDLAEKIDIFLLVEGEHELRREFTLWTQSMLFSIMKSKA